MTCKTLISKTDDGYTFSISPYEDGSAYQSRLKIVTMVPKALTAGSHVFFPNHSMPNHL